jgi:hypothetical protein
MLIVTDPRIQSGSSLVFLAVSTSASIAIALLACKIIVIHYASKTIKMDHKSLGLILLHISNTDYKDNKPQKLLTAISDIFLAGGKSQFVLIVNRSFLHMFFGEF